MTFRVSVGPSSAASWRLSPEHKNIHLKRHVDMHVHYSAEHNSQDMTDK